MLQARAKIARRYLKSQKVSAIPDSPLDDFEADEILTIHHKDQKDEETQA